MNNSKPVTDTQWIEWGRHDCPVDEDKECLEPMGTFGQTQAEYAITALNENDLSINWFVEKVQKLVEEGCDVCNACEKVINTSYVQ